MSRKVMKTTGQRRRSPRISALDSTKGDHQISTRTCRAKRNLNNAAALPPLSKLAKQVWKGKDSPENADCVEWRSLKENQKGVVVTNVGKASALPAKYILELVLDTLQRRDTYEIFAQPVDPDEVEEYYEIIKEPMDFGTMRAKLHEGMYQDLQQFEHDVFLIPENAMHFNSSGTTYFRQARAIHDLANKVFHVLKTKPESFVSEFSGTRRKSMRKVVSETKETLQSETKETLQCPSTTFQRSNRKSPPKRNFLTGNREDTSSNSHETDSRRETYMCKNENPVHTTFLSSCKALALMNQGDISYKDSLMSYVKDLGPTAQLVAKRKLLGLHESSNSGGGGGAPTKAFKTFRDFAPAGCNTNPFVKASKAIDVTIEGEEARIRDGRKQKAALTGSGGGGKTRNAASLVRDLNCKSKPVILALENHHSSRNKKRCVASAPAPASLIAQDVQQQQQKKPLPLISHFTFDLPFLKARLDQMKSAII